MRWRFALCFLLPAACTTILKKEAGLIKLDTLIQVAGIFYINVDDTIALDQKVKLPVFGKNGPNVPVQGNIQLRQSLKAVLDELVPVKGLIPVDMLNVDTLRVGVHMKIPVDIVVPVKIPLNTTARISFPQDIPVSGDIPLTLTIPVDIPLDKTELAIYFKKMAKGLKDLTVLKVELPRD